MHSSRSIIAGLAAALLCMQPLAGEACAREVLGQYGRWGAFRDPAPPRCFAVAEPRDRSPARPYLTVATWPGAGARGQIYVRLRRDARAAELRADGATVPLLTQGRNAWTRDPRDDRRLLAALRHGGRIEVRARDANGRTFTDAYPLDGAVTAIDAAAIGCLPH